jgi:arginase
MGNASGVSRGDRNRNARLARVRELVPTGNAIAMDDEGLKLVDGVEAKEVLVEQLASALEVIEQHDPTRIATLGGECAVSVAPFSALARRYGDDLAILWIDSHPDIGPPASEYPGFHAMAVAALTRYGDPDILKLLPATITPDRVALVGLHEWSEDDFPNVAEWGIQSFSPDELRQLAQPLLEWLAATGCSRVAIHFDVDTVDSNEIVLGLGAVPDGMTSRQVRRIVTDVTATADVVGVTIAEFFPPAGHAPTANPARLPAPLATLKRTERSCGRMTVLRGRRPATSLSSACSCVHQRPQRGYSTASASTSRIGSSMTAIRCGTFPRSCPRRCGSSPPGTVARPIRWMRTRWRWSPCGPPTWSGLRSMTTWW